MAAQSSRIPIVLIGFKMLPKVIGFALKSAKVIKAGLFAATFASYAWMFTWQFAALIIALLVIHELGHLRAMRAYGMQTKGIYLIPFVGGAAVASDKFPSARAEANVALMGPVFGAGFAAAFWLTFRLTDNPLFAGVAAWSAMVNLFNLLPIGILDGGRVMNSVTRSIGYNTNKWAFVGGMALCGGFFITTGAYIFGLIIIVSAIEFMVERWLRLRDARKFLRDEYGFAARWHDPKDLAEKSLMADNPMTRRQILTTLGLYIAISVVLVAVMYAGESVPGADAAMEVFKD